MMDNNTAAVLTGIAVIGFMAFLCWLASRD